MIGQAIVGAGVTVERAMLGLPEMLVVLAIVVVLFGATKLPQLGKGMGEAIGNFKKAQRNAMQEEELDEIDATPKRRGQIEGDEHADGKYDEKHT